MEPLNALYAQLLHAGFLVLRQAVDSQDHEWVRAEVELLHNVPSLINETNINRHRYFWFSERETYIEWVGQPGRERAKSRMLTFYEPVWKDMEPIVAELLSPTASAGR